MLDVSGIDVYYGHIQALRDINLRVDEGEDDPGQLGAEVVEGAPAVLDLVGFDARGQAFLRRLLPDRTLDGLYVGQPAKPTGRLIFQALARLRLIPASGHDPPVIPQPPPLQARLLHLLDVDPTQ